MNSTDSFNTNRSSSQRGRAPLPWMMILLLGALALVRPLLHITGISGEGALLHPAVAAIGATVVISAVWIGVAVATGVQRPLLTLVLAALTYGVLSILLSGILSPLLEGELQGPLATPIAIPAVLITNAVWGAVTGGIAWLLTAARR